MTLIHRRTGKRLVVREIYLNILGWLLAESLVAINILLLWLEAIDR